MLQLVVSDERTTLIIAGWDRTRMRPQVVHLWEIQREKGINCHPHPRTAKVKRILHAFRGKEGACQRGAFLE